MKNHYVMYECDYSATGTIRVLLVTVDPLTTHHFLLANWNKTSTIRSYFYATNFKLKIATADDVRADLQIMDLFIRWSEEKNNVVIFKIEWHVSTIQSS